MDELDILKMRYVVLETNIDDLMDEIMEKKDEKKAKALSSLFFQINELVKEIKEDTNE